MCKNDSNSISKNINNDSSKKQLLRDNISDISLKQQVENEISICIEVINQNDIMTEKEMRSLAFQIKRIYSHNRKLINPAKLYLSNYEQICDYLDKGHMQWDIQFIKNEIILLNKNIIYLSPDAKECLTTIDTEYIYVIGGLVDKNHFKNMTLNYSQENNIRSYKLPIKENIKISESPILTVNQVYEILVDFNITNDWKYTIEKNIPKRKILQD